MDIWKWAYSFVMLLITVAWGAFTVLIIRNSIAQPDAVRILEASGASSLMGALIVWNGNIVQHWFRKRIEETKP